jgi:large subunit ribosomal protein L35
MAKIKMKTKKAAAKRYSFTGSGKIKRTKAGKRHLMTGKTRNRLRNLGQSDLVHKTDLKKAKRTLPYG